MDIKKVTDSDKFAIILEGREMEVLRRVLQLDTRGESFPLQVDIAHHLQTLEYENSRRRSAQMSNEQMVRYQTLPDPTEWTSASTHADASGFYRSTHQFTQIIMDDPSADQPEVQDASQGD